MVEDDVVGRPSSTFAVSFRRQLDAYGQGLSKDLSGVLSFGEPTARQVLRFLLTSACWGQGSESIGLGQDGIRALPRHWVLSELMSAVDETISMDDEYEYRRLLELARLLDLPHEIASGLLARGLESADLDLKETAEEFADLTASRNALPRAEPRS